MITRRTLRRHHLFRPDSAIRQLYLYTLALCARQFGILVHAVTLMSTHEHLIVTDPQGRYPDFLRRLHRLVSLGTKVLRKWEGPTWDHESSSVVRLLTEQAVIEKLAYVMANPVKAGLVRYAHDWPGITVLPHELGRQERRAYAEIKKRGWRTLGADRVRRLSPYRRAKSFELLRDRNPTFAVGRGQKKVFFEAVAELRAFRQAYRHALEQWRAGLRSAVFPQGTWCMCRVHGAVAQT